MIPVILSGGSGTRLWPVSREMSPKPFLRIGGGRSLLQRTVLRGVAASGDDIVIVTNAAYAFRTRDELAELPELAGRNITQILEPMGRNTAPAIAVAALWARKHAGDPVLLVLPADHLIPDVDAFVAAVDRARVLAEQGEIVLFGIAPTGPETGFGYIALGEPLGESGSFRVRQFVEKPDAQRAEQFVAAGDHVWNSGMFCFRASAVLDALAKSAPDVLQATRDAWSVTPESKASQFAVGGSPARSASLTDIQLPAERFGRIRDVSIDYAVMEHATRAAVVRTSFAWSDIGSWRAVSEQLPKDVRGNTSVGEVLLLGTSNTHVQSEDRLVAAVGVEDLLVVDTPDALLVAHRGASQQVREVVDQLRKRGHQAAVQHRTDSRPWGSFTVLNEGSRFKIKRIEVRPGRSLSMQMHHHRSEHWVVVSGTARVTCGEETRLVSPNESTLIPIGVRHRLHNPGKVDLVMIEVQCGDYVGEDDIVRFDDSYGRTTPA